MNDTYDDLWARNVVRGSGGHLFHRDTGVFEQITGQITLEGSDVIRWANVLGDRLNHARALKAGYYILIAPEKHVVYSDALPPETHISTNRPVTKLLEHLKTTDLFNLALYPVDVLREARARRETYSTVDSHWNGFGVYLVYQELCRLISNQFPVPIMPLEDLNFIESMQSCDLGGRLSPPETGNYISYRKRVSKGRSIFDNTIFKRGNVRIFTNSERADLPSLVIFRDSFSTHLLPLLAESFRRIVAISMTTYYVREIIESERPDVVITALAERYLPLKHILNAEPIPFEKLSGMTPQMIAEKV